MRFSTNKSLPQQIMQTVFNRKLLILSVFLLVVVSGMFATFLITPKYEATMSILISRERVEPQINPSEKSYEITSTTVTDEEFNSELEMIKSSEVIAGVVKELDLINNQTPNPDAWGSELRGKIKSSLNIFSSSETTGKQENDDLSKDNFAAERVINRVMNNLDVIPIKKSRVIKVTYTDTDPVRAKETLEKIYQKYAELHVQMGEKPQAGQVFSEQANKFNQELNASTNALKRFDTQNGVTGAEIGVQRELLLKQLYEAEGQINAAKTEIGETEKRIASLQEKIVGQPEQIQTLSVSKYVLALDRMKEELIQLEQQRTQLLQKYQPDSRFVRENGERIQQLKKSIAEESANPPQERSFALNDLRRRLESDLANAQTSLAALKERQKNLTTQAAKLRGEMVVLNTRSIERDSLERRRGISEEAYLLYEKKARENEISQVLNKEQVMNFGIVDPPRTDGERKSPKPLLNLMVLIFVGATAGLASAFVMEKLTVTPSGYDLIVSPYEIEERLKLPLLAAVPVIKASGEVLLPQPKNFALPAYIKNKK